MAELVSHVCAVGDVDAAETTLVALNQVYRYTGVGVCIRFHVYIFVPLYIGI